MPQTYKVLFHRCGCVFSMTKNVSFLYRYVTIGLVKFVDRDKFNVDAVAYASCIGYFAKDGKIRVIKKGKH